MDSASTWLPRWPVSTWDFGAPDSYAVGRFPAGWVEYNDTYRDTVRDFWRGQGQRRNLATRVAGSSDIYGVTRRGPDASMNFVTAHDGMTLTDRDSYSPQAQRGQR